MAKKEVKTSAKAKAKNTKATSAADDFPGADMGGSLPSGAPRTSAPAGASTSMPSNAYPPPTVNLDKSQLSADQLHQLQMEEAIRESTDPASKLKKLKSPVSIASCLINVAILIVLTLAIVFIWCAFTVDKFNFGTLFVDMLEQFGIKKFFSNLFDTIGGWFGGGKKGGGGGGETPAESLIMIIRAIF